VGEKQLAVNRAQLLVVFALLPVVFRNELTKKGHTYHFGWILSFLKNTQTADLQ
jgi:hypothetical protein